MKISWFGKVWAYIRGVFSFGTTGRDEVVAYIIDKALERVSNIEVIANNISKVFSFLVDVCDKLDYYEVYIPTIWKEQYTAVRESFYVLRDALADGRFESDEIKCIIAKVKAAVKNWNN